MQTYIATSKYLGYDSDRMHHRLMMYAYTYTDIPVFYVALLAQHLRISQYLTPENYKNIQKSLCFPIIVPGVSSVHRVFDMDTAISRSVGTSQLLCRFLGKLFIYLAYLLMQCHLFISTICGLVQEACASHCAQAGRDLQCLPKNLVLFERHQIDYTTCL